ncbi:hypothetical protein Hte_001381 [Hypoxylon texense]
MKPVDLAYVSFIRSVGQDGLFLLNISKLSFRYITQLLTGGNTNIRSKGGITLPNEIWAMILNFGRKGRNDCFCLVKADVVASSPSRALLRCFRHEFDRFPNELLAGDLEDDERLSEFYLYLAIATPDTADWLEIDLPDPERLSGPGNTFDVILDTTSADACLFIPHVPDLIAIFDDGECWLCEKDRFLSPVFDDDRVESFVDVPPLSFVALLACPLCMGIEFSDDHAKFLEPYRYWPAPEDKAEDMRKILEERLEELGYTDVPVPEGACGGGFPGYAGTRFLPAFVSYVIMDQEGSAQLG